MYWNDEFKLIGYDYYWQYIDRIIYFKNSLDYIYIKSKILVRYIINKKQVSYQWVLKMEVFQYLKLKK